jgi:hypothetical protein
VSLSYVQLRLPDDQVVQLGPGSLIGRLSSAELRFTDPNVSEAHALVSLRGRELKLLALRRWFEVGGKRLSELALAPGQRIHLAPDVVLTVEAVHVSPTLLALVGVGPEPVELSASVHAIVRGEDGLQLEVGYQPEALAHVSSSTDGWVLRTATGTSWDLAAGTVVDVDGDRIEAIQVDLGAPLSTLHAPPTTPPLRIVARHDTVHLHPIEAPGGRPSAVLTGISARIISELVAFGTPVPWAMVAHEIWGDEDNERLLRQNWDRNMRSLRGRLRSLGIRDDLVRPDGHGNTELFLLPGDEIVDEG